VVTLSSKATPLSASTLTFPELLFFASTPALLSRPSEGYDDVTSPTENVDA
jgi:hypothetical protein